MKKWFKINKAKFDEGKNSPKMKKIEMAENVKTEVKKTAKAAKKAAPVKKAAKKKPAPKSKKK